MIRQPFRYLTIALIVSGVLNIGLIAALFRDRSDPFSAPLLKQNEQELVLSNEEIFLSMSRLSFRELVSYLTNREVLEEGYTKRDLAVAALVSSHHFHLEKALSGPPPQVRTLALRTGQKVQLFPSFTEEQFEAIIRFAYQEKWPLTARGLFALLQKGQKEESLEQAFFHTAEFHFLQTLFQKSGAPQDPQFLLQLIKEGNWEIFERFARHVEQGLDFSIDKRREMLLEYLALRSSSAALLLLRTDLSFVLKRLEDRTILEMLALLKKETEESVAFCLQLLRSLRSDAILQAASRTLYTYAGEIPTSPIDPKEALARFIQSEKPKTAEVEKVPSASRFHVVQSGESLWKISRLYKVPIDEIVQLNGLEKDSLFPGMTLKLPSQGTGSEPPR